ncbi:MAG: hypothetical protein A3B86_00500 [Candidatus Yanofskybacteria bacterium RIFCSPHIGHO2_02_FULL_38_22b]|uniref:N-methyl-D-aspartate receptor NMDAR2C subunit n=1 Tax=Candidatus Yanofskybacteria bacterium RIFCSPHIGHO2_02_FULL_38_22b TaxID=1802673 RepID=A0A1F8F348_9BACT|nr:MAG: hypothetical protein A2816_03765 [Candidatus Yanofskybacteria bacterium RIFCSPHIGHO2_01_FULL_39_44]OGN07561.1 MAG: hypothetical protein A3B86_00500 [Candidatus Yanofskybacteria bacterium RIFCSPHIGHO2_02_FULL_38_22b]OGN20190.1 MAG: hypothetical protein A2910_00035 [Candidatus Yanofskybacteria bacterium RIFCSPLOWO2_01_FULL_39_28]
MLATLERWRDLCHHLGAKDNPDTGKTIFNTFGELVTKHTESNRHYNNIQHLDEGLVLIDQVKHLAEKPDILEMAWWWHDETYNIKTETKLNELRSATNAFIALIELGVPDQVCVTIMARIMPTLHSYIPTDFDDKLMVDIDLVHLAAPWESFCLNAENLRKEYDTTVEKFRIRQAEFLHNFTKNRKYVFLTESFRVKYEKQARENIRRVLEFNQGTP